MDIAFTTPIQTNSEWTEQVTSHQDAILSENYLNDMLTVLFFSVSMLYHPTDVILCRKRSSTLVLINVSPLFGGITSS